MCFSTLVTAFTNITDLKYFTASEHINKGPLSSYYGALSQITRSSSADRIGSVDMELQILDTKVVNCCFQGQEFTIKTPQMKSSESAENTENLNNCNSFTTN